MTWHRSTDTLSEGSIKAKEKFGIFFREFGIFSENLAFFQVISIPWLWEEKCPLWLSGQMSKHPQKGFLLVRTSKGKLDEYFQFDISSLFLSTALQTYCHRLTFDCTYFVNLTHSFLLIYVWAHSPLQIYVGAQILCGVAQIPHISSSASHRCCLGISSCRPSIESYGPPAIMLQPFKVFFWTV